MFEKQLRNIFPQKGITKKSIILTGDVNITLFVFERSKKVQVFFNHMFSFGMISTVDKSARIARRTATAIDHMFSNAVLNGLLHLTKYVRFHQKRKDFAKSTEELSTIS